MIVKLLSEHHLEFLSFKEGCTGLYESTLVKMSHCWNLMSRLINVKLNRFCCNNCIAHFFNIAFCLTLTVLTF